jgi:hypothetical protein
MQMHEAVRAVFQSVIVGEEPVASDKDLERKVVDALSANGLGDHGYFSDYQALALMMTSYFVSIRDGHAPETPTALDLSFGTERILVRPDDVLVRPDGTRTLRCIRTGHRRSGESKSLEAAAFMLAVQRAFPNAAVELVHLADQTVQPIELSSRELQTRRDKLAGFLKDIRLGRFPAAPSSYTCPGCPAFFVCGPTPPGTLQKKS